MPTRVEEKRAMRAASALAAAAAQDPAECTSIEFRRFPKYNWILNKDATYHSGLELEAPIEHEYFSISTRGIIIARAGYAWDGATGGIDTKSIMPASVAHDIIYQANQLGFKLPKNWKKVADDCFMRLCKRDGMNVVRRSWVEKAVAWFGRGRPRDLNKYREVLVAP